MHARAHTHTPHLTQTHTPSAVHPPGHFGRVFCRLFKPRFFQSWKRLEEERKFPPRQNVLFQAIYDYGAKLNHTQGSPGQPCPDVSMTPFSYPSWESPKLRRQSQPGEPNPKEGSLSPPPTPKRPICPSDKKRRWGGGGNQKSPILLRWPGCKKRSLRGISVSHGMNPHQKDSR